MAENRSDIPAAASLPMVPADRRASPRVSMNRPVRIGPSGGLPYATVSARDLSVGGLFIDADRNVKVGARFSVEVPLRNGDRVYISEAEVVDNRKRPDGSGFGVRFVRITQDARRLLEAEVATDGAGVTLPGASPMREPSHFDPGELPTIRPDAIPAPKPLPSPPPRPESGPFGRSSVVPNTSDLDPAPTVFGRVREKWFLMKSSLQSISVFSGVLFALAVLSVLGVGILYLTDPLETDRTVLLNGPRTVTQDIHNRLVRGASPSGIETPPARDRGGEVKNPLPPRPKNTTYTSMKGPSPAAPRADARSGAVRLPALKDARREPAPPKRATPTPSPAAPRSSTRASRRLPDKGPTRRAFRMYLGPRARLRRQYILHKPERFVVDVKGWSGTPTLPPGSGPVRQIRFGRHDDFVRFVVDSARPLASANADIQAGRLKIELSFR